MKRTEEAAEISKPPPKRINGMTLYDLLFLDDPIGFGPAAPVKDEDDEDETACQPDEIWKNMDCIGYSKYDVSTHGRIRLLSNNRILKSTPNIYKKMAVTIIADDGTLKTRHVHTIVASVFLPPDESRPFVFHKNKDMTDNTVDNLMFMNKSELTKTRRKRIIVEKYGHPVNCLKDGVIIHTYDSVREASRLTGATQYDISKACRGVGDILHGGEWQYVHRDSPDDEMRYLESYGIYVSNYGRVKKSHTGHVGFGCKLASGYRSVRCDGKSHMVHNLVALAFLGERPRGTTVDHIDRNRENNHISNLRYATASEQALNTVRTAKLSTARRVHRFTVDGQYLQSFESIRVASKDPPNMSVGRIILCCKGRCCHADCKRWKYDEDLTADQRAVIYPQ